VNYISSEMPEANQEKQDLIDTVKTVEKRSKGQYKQNWNSKIELTKTAKRLKI